jgi:hypothetical protein
MTVKTAMTKCLIGHLLPLGCYPVKISGGPENVLQRAHVVAIDLFPATIAETLDR